MSYPERYAQVGALAERLRARPWFANGWRLTHAWWPSQEAPTCVMLQLHRPMWINDDCNELHIETWLVGKPIAEQKVPVLMHVLHRKTFATGDGADAFSKPFTSDPRVQAAVKSWRGYKLGKGGMTPFRKDFHLTDETLLDTLAGEFDKVQGIGEIADEYLKGLV